jgi:hypothetical protein
MRVTTSSALAVRRSGIDANPEITEDRGGRYSALFVDIGVDAVLALDMLPSSADWDGGVQK